MDAKAISLEWRKRALNRKVKRKKKSNVSMIKKKKLMRITYIKMRLNSDFSLIIEYGMCAQSNSFDIMILMRCRKWCLCRNLSKCFGLFFFCSLCQIIIINLYLHQSVQSLCNKVSLLLYNFTTDMAFSLLNFTINCSKVSFFLQYFF